MEIITHLDPDHEIYIRDSEERAEGLHMSDIVKARTQRKYPRWFKNYDDERTKRAIRHFEKGWIVEEAWGHALGRMLPFFEKPEPRCFLRVGGGKEYITANDPKGIQESISGDWSGGIWMSPDGYAAEIGDTNIEYWPESYPALVTPAIFECKAGLKSCNPKSSPITHDKFANWIEQVMGYAYAWDVNNVYLMSHHFMGTYEQRPYDPVLAVHHLYFSEEELSEHWDEVEEDIRGFQAHRNS